MREASMTYEFGNFRLDRAQKALFCDGRPVALTPKVYDTLELLAENSGRLLEKEELMQKLWPDRFVEQSNLTSNIKTLRRALGDDAANPRFVETVPRRGYRFIADVRTSDPTVSPVIASAPPAEPARKRYILISASALLLIAIFGIAFMWFDGDGLLRRRQPKFTRLTTSGKVTNTAIVPDGRSIVYSQKEGAGESLWLRDMGSGQQRQILPAQDVEFVGLTVSPDSHFAYYSSFSQNAAVQTLSRVELDGGVPEQVPVDTDVSVSFSPDGSRFAYIDTRASLKETTLKIADFDGSNQHVLIKAVGEDRIFPFFRASPAAWSPDGEAIACAVQVSDDNGLAYRILLVDPETGSEHYLSDHRWSGIENLVWQNAERLAFIELEQNTPLRRIWSVSRTTGEAHQLTNDLNGYQWLSSAGGRLVTLQKSTYSSLYVAGYDEASNVLQPKQILGEAGIINSVGWSRDDRLRYNSLASGKNEIWEINADGTAQAQLTTNSDLIYSFAVSPADDSLVFSSIRNGKIGLNAADGSGQNIHPLTDGASDILPYFSQDGANFVFQRGTSPPTLWSGTIGTGQLTQMTGYQATNPTISPDGKQIAFHFMDYGGADPHWKLGVIDTASHQLRNKLEFPISITQREAAWNPQNGLLTMAFRNGDSSGLLLWSLSDDTFKTLDNIGVGKIGAFAWSLDGDQLAYSQVFETSEVVALDNY